VTQLTNQNEHYLNAIATKNNKDFELNENTKDLPFHMQHQPTAAKADKVSENNS